MIDLVPSPNAVSQIDETAKSERELLTKFADYYKEGGYGIINESNILYLIACLDPAHDRQYVVSLMNRLTGQAFREMVGSYDSAKLQKGLTIEHFFDYMRDRGIWDYVKPFWTINSKGKFEYEFSAFRTWLESRGYRTFLRNGEQYFLKIKSGKIIREYKTDEIRADVNDTLKAHDIKILNFFHNHKGDPYKDSCLKNLETIPIKSLKDGQNKCRLYFQNGFIEVSPDGYQSTPTDLSDLDGMIWESQIRPRKILSRPSDDEIEQCEFNRFISLAMDNDPERIKGATSAFCYLIHNHKERSKGKAILATDKIISDFGNETPGRNGKGLFFLQATRELVSIAVMNKPKHNDSFPFERVKDDTRVLVYDELPENFPIREFFTPLTTDLIINKKGVPEFSIPYEDSPKVVFCSNFPIKGDTDSSFDRLFTVEFGKHFHKDHKPSDEFGHDLFSEAWNDHEWNCFYWLVIGWMQDYLQNGLQEHRTENDPFKRLIAQTSQDFAYFITGKDRIDECIVDFNSHPKTGEIRDMFLNYTSSDNAEPVDSEVFRKWLHNYASIYKTIEFSRSARHWRKSDEQKMPKYRSTK